MNDPDEKFKDALRSTDRGVSLDPELLTKQIKSARLERSRAHKRLLVGGLVSCGLLIATISFWAQKDPDEMDQIAKEPMDPIESVESLENDLASAEPTDTDDEALTQSIVDTKRRIEVIKKRIEVLNRIRQEQQRAIVRAEASRDLNSESLALYKF